MDAPLKTPELQDTRAGAFHAAHGWPSLLWSAEQPAADGWWWWQDKPHGLKRAVEIYSVTRAGRLLSRWVRDGADLWKLGEGCRRGGRWAGPLPEPVDAPDAETTANDPALRPPKGDVHAR